ncbi:MAG: adenylosuccinate lyase [Chloroflexota bacterium]|nr:adenylosuccinate lyase [Chloroflexota bacterium]
MIARYTRPAMGEVWSDHRRVAAWLRVEIEVCEAWHARGRIPAEAMRTLRTAVCDLDRMQEIERRTDHDVIAFLRAVGESLGAASRYLHLGLTSSDVVDTGLALQVTEAGMLLDTGLVQLADVLGRQAISYNMTMTVGRTHGMHAEPTTFGFKLAVWYAEVKRHVRRLALAREDLAVGKISGAVGTHAHVPPDLEEEVCAALGLVAAPVTTQVLQRDRHAFFLSTLAGIGASLDKFAVELRHLQRTEVAETAEPFAVGNQGSSAMPHKRNPHASERISGLARLLRGYAVSGLENVPLWHERDISHSSTERVIFPDACIVLDFMLAELTDILENLEVDADRMRSNVNLTSGLIFSQPLLLAMVDAGLDRAVAYQIVQELASVSSREGLSFHEVVSADERIQALLEPVKLERVFDPWEQLRHVNESFKRVGLDLGKKSPTDEF